MLALIIIIPMVNHCWYFGSGIFKAYYLTSIYLYFWNILPNIFNLNSYSQVIVSHLYIKRESHGMTIMPSYPHTELAYIRVLGKFILNCHGINLECANYNALFGPYYSKAKVPFCRLG